MAKYYSVLDRELKKRDINHSYLAELLQRSADYVSERFRGERPWTIADIYQIMDILHLDSEYIPVVFPRNGMYNGEIEPKVKPIEARLAETIKELVAIEQFKAQDKKSLGYSREKAPRVRA